MGWLPGALGRPSYVPPSTADGTIGPRAGVRSAFTGAGWAPILQRTRSNPLEGQPVHRIPLAVLTMLLAGACAAPGDIGTAAPSAEAPALRPVLAVVHKSESCSCCSQHQAHLEELRFTVVEEVYSDGSLYDFKDAAGVPEDARSCHTTIVGDYVVEGHVPGEVIRQLLEDQPAIDGIALPGMPAGSPGMPGPAEGPLEILTIDAGQVVDTFVTVEV